MFNLGKNKYFVAGFAILMAVGLMAAYIPMLFPQVPAGNADVISGNVSGNISGTANLNQNALSGTDIQTVTSTQTSTKSASLPSSLSGLQTEQNSLNDINDLLDQSQ
jgi:hypothetical protein